MASVLAGLPAGQAALIRACSSVSRAAVFASSKMADNDGAHQFEHVLRVHRTATHIASRESVAGANIDMRIVQLAAILHDVYDRKVYRPGPGDPSGAELLLRFLCTLDLPDGHAARVVAIADGVSFSKQRKTPLSEEQRSLELDIVQDADRLDAMGAVGVARCFAYGGSAGCALESSRVHFDDKLLKLVGLMRTPTGTEIARGRHTFMKTFLQQYDSEMDFLDSVNTVKQMAGAYRVDGPLGSGQYSKTWIAVCSERYRLARS